MFADGTAGPMVGWGEASPTTDSSKFSCPAWTPLASFGSRPGKGQRGRSWGRRWYRVLGWLDEKGAWHSKKNPRKRGGLESAFQCLEEQEAGGGTGVGPPGKDPGKCPVGPGSPTRAAGGVAGWNELTTEVVTAEPHPGHTQVKEEECRTTLVAAS